LLTSGNFGKAGQFLALDPAAQRQQQWEALSPQLTDWLCGNAMVAFVTSCWALPLSSGQIAKAGGEW